MHVSPVLHNPHAQHMAVIYTCHGQNKVIYIYIHIYMHEMLYAHGVGTLIFNCKYQIHYIDILDI